MNRIRDLWHFIYQVVRQFFQDTCMPRAGGLAYSSLLAIVPLFAVLLGFSGSRVKDSGLQEFLANTLLPTRQEVFVNAISEFAANSNRLGTMGLLIFLITVVILLNTIETHLNRIFRLRTDRAVIHRLTTYTAVLVFAGLSVGASVTLSGNVINTLLETYGHIHVSSRLWTQFASYLFIFLTLLLLLLIMPSGKIRLSSALLGAVCGSIFWEIAKRGFAAWANQSVRISVIYGSLFLIPLLLIWLYVVWILILLSAEITFVHQHRDYCRTACTGEFRPGEQIRKGIGLFSLIARAYRKREAPPELHELSEMLNLPDREAEGLLALLIDKELVRTVRKSGRGDGYVPGVPLEKQSVLEVLEVLTRYSPLESARLSALPDRRILKLIHESLTGNLEDRTIGELLDD